MRTFHGIVEQIAKATNAEDLPPMRDLRLSYLVLVLGLCEQNKSRAARVLGVDVKTIYNHLAELEQIKPTRTMTDVVRELDKAMTVAEDADFNIGPDQAAEWSVEPGHYKWQGGEAVRVGDYPGV